MTTTAGKTWQFVRVAGPYSFTEGPVWTGTAVLFTDIPSSRVLRYDPDRGDCVEYAADTGGGNGMTLDGAGRLLVCAGRDRQLVRYRPNRTRQTLADRFDGQPLNSPNDVIVDGRGRIWFTDPRYGERTDLRLGHESVYRLDPDGTDDGYTITRVSTDTTRPNGLALSLDEHTLYVAESPPAPDGVRQLRAYPVRPDGSLGPPRVLHDFGAHRGIDGMRVDRSGCVVAACGSTASGPGPRVAVFGPDGTVLAEYPVPADPTNLVFGDADLGTVYLTAKDGGLYRARTDRRGLVPPRFATR